MTKGARERAYRVQLHALMTERQVCGMMDEEYNRRAKEIWEICFRDADILDKMCD